ncbi:HAD family hydrolase [Uliginosibacterium sediminicola]|uniref:HAD family hydrolase n=1 Tax=Uliginosibacterium sediminicola TaxID=2024550 RepID=A0ABU9YXY5_9RHOO
MMKSVAAVLFDLDETLIDRRAGLLKFARGLWAEACPAVSEDVFVRDFIALDDLGATSRPELFRQLVARHLPEHDPASLLQSFLATAWLAPKLFDDALHTLQTLEARGWRIGIVSNGSTQTQRAKIENTALHAWADVSVISESFGCKKPDPRIYHHALQMLGASAADSWFVGDCAVNDVIGANALGMRTAWVERHGSWPAQHVPVYTVRIQQLHELLDIIH